MAQAAELILNGFLIGRVGPEIQVAAKGGYGFGDAAEVHEGHTALLVFVGGFGIGGKKEIEEAESLVGGFGGEVDVTEVVDHPHDDGPAVYVGQHFVGEGIDAGESAAAVEIDEDATVEGVHKSCVVAVVVLNDEVAGEGDAVDGFGEAAADFHVDERERDGDAEAGVEDAVQAAVFGGIVVVVVAAEAEFAEEIGVGGLDEIAAVGEVVGAGGNFESVAVEEVEVFGGVEVGILDSGDFEGGSVEFEVGWFTTEQIEQLLC